MQPQTLSSRFMAASEVVNPNNKVSVALSFIIKLRFYITIFQYICQVDVLDVLTNVDIIYTKTWQKPRKTNIQEYIKT